MSKPAEPLTLRLARSDERKSLEQLQWRASLANENDRPHLEANPDAIDLPAEQITNGQVTVAEIEGSVVGFSALIAGELDGLFVEPELWNLGIGRTLVNAAADVARREGQSLRVIANPAALGFYKKCGFVAEGEVRTRFGPGLRMIR